MPVIVCVELCVTGAHDGDGSGVVGVVNMVDQVDGFVGFDVLHAA